jgi:hypothetical protein
MLTSVIALKASCSRHRRQSMQENQRCCGYLSLAGLLAQFKPDRPPSFLLPDRRPIRCVPTGSDILDPYGYDIKAAKFTVDCQIEHREVACAAFDLEFRPDRPDVLGSQWWLSSSQLSFVPQHSLNCIYLILHGHTPRLGY